MCLYLACELAKIEYLKSGKVVTGRIVLVARINAYSVKHFLQQVEQM